jgi:hypothetical protein
LRRIFYLFTTDEHLRVHGKYLLLKQFLLLLLHEELSRSDL